MNIKITLDNTGDHPLFNFTLLAKDGKYRIEQILRFAACRDFHQAFIVPCGVKLESPFPVTQRRSSLGIKLSEDTLVNRTTTLNMYMSEILNRFNEFSPEVQNAYITLLSSESVPLEYFKDQVIAPVVAPLVINRSSRESLTESFRTNSTIRSTFSKSNVQKSSDELPGSGFRTNSLQNQMEIKILLINTGDHPLYRMQLSSKDEVYNVEQTMRFGQYRDFYDRVMENCSLKMSAEFPPTLKRSSLGIKLTEEELVSRASNLEKYLNEIISRFKDLPVDSKVAVIGFLKADHIPVTLFHTLAVDPDIDLKPTSRESTSLSKKLKHQISNLSNRNIISAGVGVVEKKRSSMAIQVSRNSSEAHVKFDVLIRAHLSEERQITVCSRLFNDFRQLRNSIFADLEDTETQVAGCVFPPFPRTFARSSFGIPLSEGESIARVRDLDNWLRAVAKFFHRLSDRSQLEIVQFLNLDCLVNNEKYETVIREQLKSGNVYREEDDLSGGVTSKIPDGLGKYAAVSLPESPDLGNPLAAIVATTEVPEAEWMIIGSPKTEEEAPPPLKGCCVMS